MAFEIPAAYFETRFRLDAPVAAWPEAFVIISAFATTGEVWTDEQNRGADATLKRNCARRASG